MAKITYVFLMIAVLVMHLPENHEEDMYRYLKFDNLSSEVFDSIWKGFKQYRFRDLQTLGSTTAILEWPFYKYPSGFRSGFRLIEMDFNACYDKTNSLLKNWQSYHGTIVSFLCIESYVKDKNIRSILERMKSDNDLDETEAQSRQRHYQLRSQLRRSNAPSYNPPLFDGPQALSSPASRYPPTNVYPGSSNNAQASPYSPSMPTYPNPNMQSPNSRYPPMSSPSNSRYPRPQSEREPSMPSDKMTMMMIPTCFVQEEPASNGRPPKNNYPQGDMGVARTIQNAQDDSADDEEEVPRSKSPEEE